MNNLEQIKLAHQSGQTIQYANANSDGAWGRWQDYDGGKNMVAPMSIDNNGGYRKWQIKPSILETTRQIIQKHKLEKKLDFNPFKLTSYNGNKRKEWFDKSRVLENGLFSKWGHRVGENWYGFDLCGCPENWFAAIDEFLTELEKDSPDFKILQYKLKWGSFRGYMSGISEGAQNAIDLLEEVMQDENLIY
jgi:hypothetical protein